MSKSDDTIRRQDALDALEEQLDYLQMLNKDENPRAESKWYGVNWARNTIADLPSAEPKTGKWVEVDCHESEKHSVTDMRCSLCGKYASIVLPHRTRCVYNFCPNCGARMVREDG